MNIDNSQAFSDKYILAKATEILLHTKHMREAQITYFKTRSSKDLQTSKRCESLVDRELREFGEVLRSVRAQGHQVPLFDKQEGAG